MTDWDRTDPAERWAHRNSGLYERGQQLGGYDFHVYRRSVADADNLTPEQAAWIARDLILNAGERGGAEAVGIDLLRDLRAVAGGPSIIGIPRALDPQWSRVLYRGGRSPEGASWTNSQRVAVTYAACDRRGRERRSLEVVWTITAEPADVLAVVPVAYEGGPMEWVLDPSRITRERVAEMPDAVQIRQIPRIGGRVAWERAR